MEARHNGKFDSFRFHMDINPIDRKFIPVDPDPGFNPERNKQVIESTIRKYDQQRTKKKKAFVDTMGERSEAVASWLTSAHGAMSNKPIERYFTKRYLSYLRGREIADTLKSKYLPEFTGGGYNVQEQKKYA